MAMAAAEDRAILAWPVAEEDAGAGPVAEEGAVGRWPVADEDAAAAGPAGEDDAGALPALEDGAAPGPNAGLGRLQRGAEGDIARARSPHAPQTLESHGAGGDGPAGVRRGG